MAGNPRRAAPIGRGIAIDRSASAADNDFLQFNTTTNKWEFVTASEAGLLSAAANETVTGDWIFQDQITIQDVGGTDDLTIQHDGSNVDFDFTNTTYANFNFGGTTYYRINAGGALELLGGTDLRIYDATDTDYMTFSHDGSHFIARGTNTAYFIFDTLTGVQLNDGAQFRVFDAANSASFSLYIDSSPRAQWQFSGVDWLEIEGLSNGILLRDGNELRIYNSGDTDYSSFSHDGTDFNAAFTNTTDWNVTGLVGGRMYFNSYGSRIQTGPDTTGSAASFGAANTTDAGSFNYRTYWAYDSYWDHDNEEWAASRTTLGRKFMIDMGYHNDSIRFRYFDGTVSSPWADTDWDNAFIIHGAAARIDVQNGWAFRIYNSGNTDYGHFSHDGTNFTLNVANTDNVDFTGVSDNVRIRDGAGLVIYNDADTDYGLLYHDGTDFNFTTVNTTEINFTGYTGFMQGARGQIAEIQYAFKTSDESVTSSTTLQDDNELANISLEAGGVYLLEAQLFVTLSTTATQDFKAQLVFSSAPTSSRGDLQYEAATSNNTASKILDPISTAWSWNIGNNRANAAWIRGYVDANAATTLKLQWAQNTSSANATTVKAGSWIKLTRVA